MLLSRTVRLFLDSIGRRDEYEYYLDRFSKHEGRFFALIHPDREAVELSGDLLAFHLDLLAKLGLQTALLMTEANAGGLADCIAAYPDTFVSGEEPKEGRVCVIDRSDQSAHDALLDLVPSFGTRVHLIRCVGALRDDAGNALAAHHVRHERRHTLAAEDHPVAELCADLLAAHNALHVSICSAHAILEELFTVKGHGTLVRRGSRILETKDLGELNMERVQALFQSGFGKALREDVVFPPGSRIFYEADYRGMAILEPHSAGALLSKFVVSHRARGEGLAQELWDAACRDEPALFWRARSDNPINTWYDREADGRQSGPQWNIYWRGIDAATLSDIILYCREREPDFVEPGT